jgi:hypothetical protein
MVDSPAAVTPFRRGAFLLNLFRQQTFQSYIVDTGFPLLYRQACGRIIRSLHRSPNPPRAGEASQCASANPHSGRPLCRPDDYSFAAGLAFLSSLRRCQGWARSHRKSNRVKAGHRSSRHQHACDGRRYRCPRDTSNLTQDENSIPHHPRCSSNCAAYATLGAWLCAKGRCRN